MKQINTTQAEAKPFLKWVGGKTQLLPQLRSLFPQEYNRYFEPFLGGGAVFFALTPGKAILNDLNHKLINAYQVVRDHTEDLCNYLERIEREYLALGEEQRRAYYYEVRTRFNTESLEKTELAADLLFLNKTGFNGIYRENSRGEFNTPFGRYSRPRICNPDAIRASAAVLKKAKLLNKSFEGACNSAKAGDFVYFDPPYFPLEDSASFTGYHQDNFYAAEQHKLRELYERLAERGCLVMLSNSDTSFIRSLYKGYKINQVYASRAVNCKANGRGKVTELVITNY